MQHDMPPHRLDARDQAMEDVEVGDTAQVLDEIEANTANAALVEAPQFTVRHGVVDTGDASIGSLTRGNAVKGHPHVRAMATRVDERAAGHAELGVQRTRRVAG